MGEVTAVSGHGRIDHHSVRQNKELRSQQQGGLLEEQDGGFVFGAVMGQKASAKQRQQPFTQNKRNVMWTV